MKRSSNVLTLLIVASVAIIGIAVMLLAPFIVNNFSDFSDVVGFAAHSVYPSFSAAESGFAINGNALTVADTAVYKTGYYSINGAAWQNFTLVGNVLNGSWLSNNANVILPNFGSGESYVVIYSCTKNAGVWNCHDNKWQLKIINNTANPSSALSWSNELMINGGFESGTLNGWTTSGGGWKVGYHLGNAQYALPQSGSYNVFINGSSDINGFVYQDVDLTDYATYIDVGKAMINASGWGVSSESPGQDLSRIQIMFLNSAKGIIAIAADSGDVSSGIWWQKGISDYLIPSGTRYIRMWGNTYEQGYSSGSLDNFSVKVGYGGTVVIPPACNPSCSGKQCGSDGCSGTCGTCLSMQSCNSNGLCINNPVSPPATNANTVYISTTGSDNTGNGSSVKPWKSLAYACSHVISSGSIIHVNAGTYTETSQCILAPGVSIEGENTNPLTSIIVSTYAASLDNQYDASILLLSSSSSATDGDQSISYIKLDGNNLAGKRGISVRFRNYVSIHDCTISNFDYSGVYFSGTTTGYPTITSSRYDYGNSVYNCNIINNAHGMDGTGIFGDLLYDAQQDFLIHDNVFDQTERLAGTNGDTLNGVYSKGIKIYNNVFYRNDYEDTEWNFFSEIFFTAGGEIYNNTFHGLATLDIVDVRKGTYDFGIKVYNNQFLVDAQVPETYHGIQAIDFEEVGQVQYVYVYNNHFKNSNTAVQFDATGTTHYKTPVNGVISMDHLYIYYNIFENMGAIGNKYYAAIVMKPTDEDNPFNIVWNQIYIDNNVILSGSTYQTWCGIEWQQGGNYSNIYIRNNIIRGSSQYPIIFYDGGATVPGTQTNINIQNNLYYLNGANQVGYIGTSQNQITGLTQYTPTFANPNFVSPTDFHLAKGSPAIDAGISTGWTSDYSGNSVPYPANGAPDIGAYESR